VIRRTDIATLGASLVTISLLSACSIGSGRNSGPTLASLKPLPLPQASRELPSASIELVVSQYRAVLKVAVDPETRIDVQRRLAGLEMLHSEQRQIDSPQLQRYFDEAIALHQTLLAAHPQRGDNDRLLYQMAKAYELDGRVEESALVLGRLAAGYPDSEYYAEAQFRHAEMLFSQQQYAAAEQAYSAVVAAGKQTSYYDNAIYMQGWTLFKQSSYESSLASFTQVLDRTIPDSGSIEALPRGEAEMAEDTLRVMSLAFSYLQGAESIRDFYGASAARPYQHLVYQGLGQLYLEKQRYRDSAETYALYVEHYPDTAHAPEFSGRLIDVYQQGGFPSEILPAKEGFARRYGLHSNYWSAAKESVREDLRRHLYQYLEELASHHHASAQILQQQWQRDSLSQPAVTKNGADEPADLLAQQSETRTAYLTAGNWYAQFVQTFPDDSKTPGMVFLMAESLDEAAEYPRAIAAYERVAYGEYEHRDSAQGAEAGYSAILAYDRQLSEVDAEQLLNWRLQKVESELRFAEVYPCDQRALPVLAHAAEELLQLGEAADAVVAARRVTSWQPEADPGLRRTAWLVQGHGTFQLADYVGAELAYQGALALIEADDDSRSAVVDRLAASVYKQAEAHLIAGERAQGIDDFLRVASVAPESAIAITAAYDGANGLMELQDWGQAERVLISFRHQYPNHELAQTVPAKLVHIYQQRGDWRQAADELTTIAASDEDPQVRRKSLYMAAELYQKDAEPGLASERYRDYVKRWPQPFDLANEARYQLNEIYRELGDNDERRVWLQQLVSAHDNAGVQTSGRSLYLAAMAATVFSEDAYLAFRDAPLTLPLANSFKTKKKRMKATLAACDKVLGYGVAEFVTEANFRIGDVYTRLSADLMASQRPLNLNALELEQYDLLLEEQAYPFEEKAISIHEANARRSWSGVYDQWVRRSIDSLATLLPARYGKTEVLARYSDDIH
jgi:TolA-binding protein